MTMLNKAGNVRIM